MAGGRIAVAFLFVFLRVYAVNVAPGDGDEKCLTQPNRESVPSNQKVLLDTQDYDDQSLVTVGGGNGIWITEDYDMIKTPGAFEHWIDNSQVFTCSHSFLSCDTDNQPQDNWLITQYINISNDDVSQVHVFMSFQTTSGSNCATCKEFFTVQVYNTNVTDEVGRTNQSRYTDIGVKFFHTLSNVNVQSDTRPVAVSANGVYLAIVDSGSCTFITRMYVFYYVCPHQVDNMVEYPEVTSAVSGQVKVTGKCINNSSPVEGESLELVCNSDGLWIINTPSCSCDPGYEPIMEICEPCIEGEYKYLQGNSECITCPDNSNTTDTGSTRCDCNNGYYRTSTENETVRCTAPPSAPMNVVTDGINSMSINIKWSSPTDNGGRSDISYIVTYSNGSFTGPMSPTVSLSYNITGLTPSTQYNISVISVNGVSDQDEDNVASRTITINATTNDRGPSKPNGIALSEDGVLRWSQPEFLYGNLLYYNIWIATSDNFSLAMIKTTTKNTSYDLNTLEIEKGIYYFWVQAVTDNGLGEISESTRHVAFGPTEEANSNIVPVVAGVVGGIVFLLALSIILIVIILAVVFLRNNKRNYVSSSEPINGVNPSSKEMELGILPLPSNDTNKMYIDPRNYSSLNQAFDETGVKEIPPKEICNLEEIGLGEFGLVYKGLWSLKNVKVAVKTLKGGANEEQKRNFLFEASVMAQFRHTNVVKLYGIISRVDPIMIIMEYMDNGSLDRYLQKHLDKLGLKRQLKLSHGVSLGMSYLSEIGFVHRDLAARNILVSKDETPKVADFGLAREMVENEYDVQRGGRIPVRWTAPEAISHRSFSTASDVWSFGVLVWEIMTYGETPYEGWDNYAVLDRLEDGERLKQPRYCPDDVYQLMLCCWERERSERPSFDNIAERLEILMDGKPKPKPKPRHLKVTPPPEPPSPTGPQIQTVEDFLRSISMLKYLDNFHTARLYNVQDLFNLTEDDLESIDITLGGHQHKIIKNIAVMREGMGTSY